MSEEIPKIKVAEVPPEALPEALPEASGEEASLIPESAPPAGMDDIPDIEEAPAPKKRGRPPKPKPAPTTPKKRGRPPKAVAATPPRVDKPEKKRGETVVTPPVAPVRMETLDYRELTRHLAMHLADEKFSRRQAKVDAWNQFFD